MGEGEGQYVKSFMKSFIAHGLQIMHKSVFSVSSGRDLLRELSARGACWAHFTRWKSRIMICKVVLPGLWPSSLPGERKHLHLIKIGQCHSVDQPRWYTRPLGPRFMAPWSHCALTRAQRLHSAEQNGFVWLALGTLPGCLYSRETWSKCQPHHQEWMNWENDAALYKVWDFFLYLLVLNKASTRRQPIGGKKVTTLNCRCFDVDERTSWDNNEMIMKRIQGTGTNCWLREELQKVSAGLRHMAQQDLTWAL